MVEGRGKVKGVDEVGVGGKGCHQALIILSSPRGHHQALISQSSSTGVPPPPGYIRVLSFESYLKYGLKIIKLI